MAKAIISFIFIIIFIVGGWFGYYLFSENRLSESSSFVIEQGESVNQISQNLYESGLIKNKFVFESWLWFKKLESQVVAGVYTLPQDLSIRELINILTLGPQNSQSSILLIEGWDRRLMSQSLDKKGLSGDDFLDLTKSKNDWQEDYDFLSDAASDATLEGYIFPDTYFVDGSGEVRELIVKALNNFDKKLNKELRAEISRQNKTIFEVITLASIVEREVPKDSDKKMIADIFLKRLDEGIGLQSDATINFITGKGLVSPSFEDLQVESPYNTYKYRGLPPGPISSPGLSSIEAVVYPTPNNYFYFLTTPEGEVIYSRTHDEHVQNKAKYLQ